MLRPTRTHWLNSLLVHLPIVVALLWTPESWFIAWGTNPILSTQGTQVELSAEANPATPQAAQTMTPQSVFKYAGELLRGSLDSSPASAEQTTPNVPSPLDNASGPQASPAAAQSTLGLSDGNEVSAAAQVAFSPTEGGQEFPGYQLLGLTSEDIDRLRATGDAMVVVALDRRPFLVEGPLASPQVRPVALSALAGFSERRLYLPSALSRSVQESFRQSFPAQNSECYVLLALSHRLDAAIRAAQQQFLHHMQLDPAEIQAVAGELAWGGNQPQFVPRYALSSAGQRLEL